MILRLGELCGADDDALRHDLTVHAGLFWTSSACAVMIAASQILAGAEDKMSRLVRSEGAVQVLSMGVCCGIVTCEDLGRLAALSGCSIAGLLDEQAKHVLQQQREGYWVGLSDTRVEDVMALNQFPSMMRSPFTLELDAIVALVASLIDPAPAAGAGSKGVVASVAALRAAFAAAKPILNGMAAIMLAAGKRPLCAVACCNVYCSRGGPALLGGGDAWVGPSDQPFCSRACMAAHIAMCRDSQGQ